MIRLAMKTQNATGANCPEIDPWPNPIAAALKPMRSVRFYFLPLMTL